MEPQQEVEQEPEVRELPRVYAPPAHARVTALHVGAEPATTAAAAAPAAGAVRAQPVAEPVARPAVALTALLPPDAAAVFPPVPLQPPGTAHLAHHSVPRPAVAAERVAL